MHTELTLSDFESTPAEELQTAITDMLILTPSDRINSHGEDWLPADAQPILIRAFISPSQPNLIFHPTRSRQQ